MASRPGLLVCMCDVFAQSPARWNGHFIRNGFDCICAHFMHDSHCKLRMNMHWCIHSGTWIIAAFIGTHAILHKHSESLQCIQMEMQIDLFFAKRATFFFEKMLTFKLVTWFVPSSLIAIGEFAIGNWNTEHRARRHLGRSGIEVWNWITIHLWIGLLRAHFVRSNLALIRFVSKPLWH